VPWPALQHGCYRGSRAATGAIVAMLSVHRVAGTFAKTVDTYIAPSGFVRRKYVENGFPEKRVLVKPHVVYPDRGIGNGSGGYALFVGRLSAEKGLTTLIAAWRQLRRDMPLLIVGDGPLAPLVIEAAREEGIIWLGRRPVEQVHDLLARARCLVLPSECYETFGRVAAEAYAAGTPVIAANGGSMREMVSHERTGLLFEQGSADDLVRQVRLILRQPALLREMRLHARAEFEARYGATANTRELLTVYRRAIAWRRATPASPREGRARRITAAVRAKAVGSDVHV
jgi:glycosyltransferase involved in cell wall biosynthesis